MLRRVSLISLAVVLLLTLAGSVLAAGNDSIRPAAASIQAKR